MVEGYTTQSLPGRGVLAHFSPFISKTLRLFGKVCNFPCQFYISQPDILRIRLSVPSTSPQGLY